MQQQPRIISIHIRNFAAESPEEQETNYFNQIENHEKNNPSFFSNPLWSDDILVVPR